MGRPLVVAAAIAITAGGAAIAWLLLGGPVRPRRDSLDAAAPSPGALTAPAVAASAPAARSRYPGDDVPAAREETSTFVMRGGEAFGASLTAALAPRIGADARLRAAIAEARAGTIDAVSLEGRLRDAVGDDPVLGATLLEALLAEGRPDLALKEAQVLAGLLDDPALLARAIEGLRAAPPGAREVGLMALLGRGEPAALALAAEAFVSDPQAGRATAGFLLNNAPGPLPPGVRVRAEIGARAALEDPAASARLREESCGVLGRPGLLEADEARLERALLSAPEATVRGRALRALVDAGLPRARLRLPCERALGDPANPEELKQAIRIYLASDR